MAVIVLFVVAVVFAFLQLVSLQEWSETGQEKYQKYREKYCCNLKDPLLEKYLQGLTTNDKE